ncbi:FAD-dependent oxidoreductase [Candidatus Epulonipiscium viviparus]|uniref:FAD-dependent oxidoreductase n=1 Tax=Candidatus Epulonipiscium viviparus TaxID=420336 RepID=UPI0004974D80|nr:FAD-dependent oxidoreductase [Candidatus Epulopiscium viviparus]
MREYDFIVVGGGMSGVCAAISAARNGVKTALVHNRPVLGGNASSEVKVSINGAGRIGNFQHAMESGIILEILLKNKKFNVGHSFNILDHINWEFIKNEPNIDLYLNTSMTGCVVEDNKIKSITAFQVTTQKEFVLAAKLFCDTTGDANLAYAAGADYTIGHEARSTYNESLAPEVATKHTMGSTLLFTTRDLGKPVKFTCPEWAYKMTKEYIGKRKVHELSNGYWWCEVGGDDDFSTTEDAEEVRDELIKYAYGIFDYIKNSGEYPEAENLMLDWFGAVPGKRESRRIIGDYVLNQNDIQAHERFADAVAYGGWSMDDHIVGGIRAKVWEKAHKNDEGGSIWHPVRDVYTIPYRSLYSRNIENLYAGGRCFSVSHMAMSSTRVIGTCSVIGQAIGTAAAIATKYDILPRQVNEHIKELQQLLIKDDAYLPSIKTEDKDDLISNNPCKITASSYQKNCEPKMINSDFARRIYDDENAWVSEKLEEDGQFVEVEFEKLMPIKELVLRFDPDFNRTVATSIAESHRDRQVEEMPYQLVKSYVIEYFQGNEKVASTEVEGNYQRVNKHHVDVIADKIKITVLENYGDPYARICDLRIY